MAGEELDEYEELYRFYAEGVEEPDVEMDPATDLIGEHQQIPPAADQVQPPRPVAISDEVMLDPSSSSSYSMTHVQHPPPPPAGGFGQYDQHMLVDLPPDKSFRVQNHQMAAEDPPAMPIQHGQKFLGELPPAPGFPSDHHMLANLPPAPGFPSDHRMLANLPPAPGTSSYDHQWLADLPPDLSSFQFQAQQTSPAELPPPGMSSFNLQNQQMLAAGPPAMAVHHSLPPLEMQQAQLHYHPTLAELPPPPPPPAAMAAHGQQFRGELPPATAMQLHHHQTPGQSPTSAAYASHDQTIAPAAPPGDEAQFSASHTFDDDDDNFNVDSFFANDEEDDLAAAAAAAASASNPEPPMAADETAFAPLVPGQLRCDNHTCLLSTEVRHHHEGRVKYFLVHSTPDGTAFTHVIMYDVYNGADGQFHRSDSMFLDVRRRTPEWVRGFVADHVETLGNRAFVAHYVNGADQSLPPASSSRADAANEAHRRMEIDMLGMILSAESSAEAALAPLPPPQAAPAARVPEPPPATAPAAPGTVRQQQGPPPRVAPTSRREPRIVDSGKWDTQHRHEASEPTKSRLTAKQRERAAAAANAEPVDEGNLRGFLTEASVRAQKELAAPVCSITKSFCRNKRQFGLLRTKITTKNKRIVKNELTSRKLTGRALANMRRTVAEMEEEKVKMHALITEAMYEAGLLYRQCRNPPPGGAGRDDDVDGPGSSSGGGAGVGLV